MAVNLSAIDDIVLETLNVWRPNRYKDLAQVIQRFEWVQRFIKATKKPIAGGYELEESFKVRDTGSARLTGLFGGRNVPIVPHMKKIRVPWALVEATWGYDIREPAFQGGGRAILHVINVREQSMYCDYAKLMENFMWSAADGPAEDPSQVWGIPTWATKGTNTNFAFGGGNPTGFTDGVGGISSTEVQRWANGTFKYSEVSNDDLFKKWAEAHEKCYFEPPYSYEGESTPEKPNWVNYTTYPVIAAIQSFLTTANDNLLTDAGKFRGTITFKGTPVRNTPALTNDESEVQDTQHPIYGIDWSKLFWFFLRGWDMKITGPERMPNQTHGRFVQLDSIGNFICLDRSALYVGHTDEFAQAA
jgi:hypothetical protein